VKIRRIKHNNHRKGFEVATRNQSFFFPYVKLEIPPSRGNVIKDVSIDRELGDEAFTYVLQSGDEGSVHIDHVLEYNRDPTYLKELLLYKLTLEAQRRVECSPLSKRELIRRLGTSASQFYRVLDQTNYSKSIGQVLALLDILGCEVSVTVRERQPDPAQ